MRWKRAILVPLTNEPRVGGQAGLVIVLVGAGAHCVWSHPAVHHVISQPRPAWKEAQHSERKTSEDWVNTHLGENKSTSDGPIFGTISFFLQQLARRMRAASKWVSRCNICFRAANRCCGQSAWSQASASVSTSSERSIPRTDQRTCDYELEKRFRFTFPNVHPGLVCCTRNSISTTESM